MTPPTTDIRAAAQQALEALEYHVEQTRPIHQTSAAIDALRAALAAPEQEPDMRHPKIPALIGSRARKNIEMMLVEQLLQKGPDTDLTAMDMAYWNSTHDKLREALLRTAEAEPDEPERRCGGPGCDGNCCQPVAAAVAEPVDPSDPGHDVDVLREHVRHLERRVRELHTAVAGPVAYSVGRTLHWHACRGVDDAQLYAAPPQREPQWVPVAERLPPSGQTVLACYVNRAGRLRRIRAEWIAAKSVESNSEHSDIGVYDEATDTFYDPEGWYERIDNWGDYSAVGVCEGDVTHWMPLPDAPVSAPKDAG